MLKRFALVGLVLATCAGCISMPAGSTVPVTGYVPLRFRAEISGRQFPGGFTGYDGVGNVAPAPELFIRPGKHEIWYSCPDVLYTDSGPSLSYNFQAGASYELVCPTSGDAFIRVSTHGT